MSFSVHVRVSHPAYKGVSTSVYLPSDDLNEDLYMFLDDVGDSEGTLLSEIEDDLVLAVQVDGSALYVPSNYPLTTLNTTLQTLVREFSEDLLEAVTSQKLLTIDDLEALLYNEGVLWYEGVDSLEDTAEKMVENAIFGEVPKRVRKYLDYSLIAFDLEEEGWRYHEDTKIAVKVEW